MFGIHNLKPEHTEMIADGVYITTVNSRSTSVTYISTLLDSLSNALFISLQSWESLTQTCSATQKQHLKHKLNKKQSSCYFVKNKYTPSLANIKTDMARVNIENNRTLIINCPASILLTNSEADCKSFLFHLKKLASKKNLVCMVIIHGEESHNINNRLMHVPSLFLGVSNLFRVEALHFTYHINYWISSQAISSAYEYDLTLNERGELTVTDDSQKQQVQQTAANDNAIMYISKYALDTNQIPTTDMRVFDDNEQLFNAVQNLSDASIIFSLNQQTEVRTIAIQCYQLRRNFGKRFKLIIREMQQCLRYSDEMLLSHAGINLIVPSSVAYSRFLSMIATCQGQEISRNLPHSLESLLQFDTSVNIKGYVKNPRFVEHCQFLIRQFEHTKVHFALIKLTLLPGIDASACLSMCHIKRDGDLITACKNTLYLVINSVRGHDIDIALKNIFKLPITDIFQSHTLYESIHSVESQLPHILNEAISIEMDVKKLIDPLSSDPAKNNEQVKSPMKYASHAPLEFNHEH